MVPAAGVGMGRYAASENPRILQSSCTSVKSEGEKAASTQPRPASCLNYPTSSCRTTFNVELLKTLFPSFHYAILHFWKMEDKPVCLADKLALTS